MAAASTEQMKRLSSAAESWCNERTMNPLSSARTSRELLIPEQCRSTSNCCSPQTVAKIYGVQIIQSGRRGQASIDVEPRSASGAGSALKDLEGAGMRRPSTPLRILSICAKHPAENVLRGLVKNSLTGRFRRDAVILDIRRSEAAGSRRIYAFPGAACVPLGQLPASAWTRTGCRHTLCYHVHRWRARLQCGPDSYAERVWRCRGLSSGFKRILPASSFRTVIVLFS